jgi:hypothetical protein
MDMAFRYGAQRAPFAYYELRICTRWRNLSGGTSESPAI